MSYIPVYAERGRMLFRFDPQRAIIEIRQRGTVYRVNLATVARDGGAENAVTTLMRLLPEQPKAPEPPQSHT